MGTEKKEVSLFEVGKGALSMIPDLPLMSLKLLGLATLKPSSKRSMGGFFQNQAAAYPDSPFIHFEEERLTYWEANEIVNKMARALQAKGVAPSDPVGILSENRAEAVLAVLACAKMGAVAALLNFNQTGEVQKHSLGIVQPKVLLVGDAGFSILEDVKKAYPDSLSGVQCLSFSKEPPTGSMFSPFYDSWSTQSGKNLEITASIVANQPLFYIFTSGTTGLPKASIMSHYRWLQAMNGMGSAIRLRRDDVFYCCLPLYHNNALTVSLGVTLSAGACFALDRKFSASRFWDRIRHYDATAFCYIGELLRYLLNQPEKAEDQNHSVRLITGNGLRPEIWSDFEERFGIHQIFEFYGASESNLGFMNTFGLRETVGFTPMPFKIIKVDPETEEPFRNRRGRCVSVKRGEVGLLVSEVTVRRPFDGYTDSKANEKKLLKNVFSKGDVWFNSGDLVRRQGWQHIQFVDRLGDTFRWKGENVATSEVEGVISQLPWVEQAVVYGVKIEGADGRAGMVSILVSEDGKFVPDQLAELVRSKLPSYAVPVYVRVVQSLETTGTHKIQKTRLKKEAYDQSLFSDPLYEWKGSNQTGSYQLLPAAG